MEIGKGRSKKCGDQNGESKSCGDSVRAEKKGERKKGKSVFESGMKLVLRIGVEKQSSTIDCHGVRAKVPGLDRVQLGTATQTRTRTFNPIRD